MKSLPLWILDRCLWEVFQGLSIAELQNYVLFHNWLIFQIHKKNFLIWGQGNNDSISFQSWDLTCKKYIPLFTAIYNCIVVITGLKNLTTLKIHRFKYTPHTMVKEDNIFCLKKLKLSYYLPVQNFSYPQGLPGSTQRTLHAVFSIASMLVL